jgi:hypothetical protein
VGVIANFYGSVDVGLSIAGVHCGFPPVSREKVTHKVFLCKDFDGYF